MQPTEAMGPAGGPTEKDPFEARALPHLSEAPVGSFRGRVVRCLKSVSGCSLIGLVLNSAAFSAGIVGSVLSYDTLGWCWYLLMGVGACDFFVDAWYLNAAATEPVIGYLRLDVEQSCRRANELLAQVKEREAELSRREECASLREGILKTTRLSNSWQSIVKDAAQELKAFVLQVQTFLRRDDHGSSEICKLLSGQFDIETNDVLALVDHIQHVSRKWLELFRCLSDEIQKEKAHLEAQKIPLRERHEVVVQLVSMLDEIQLLSQRVASTQRTLEHAIQTLGVMRPPMTVQASQELALRTLRELNN